MIIPEYNKVMTQNPIMSLIFSPAIAKSGTAQNGWIILVQASPHATAVTTLAGSIPKSSAAGKMIGACIAHCPPPEGTNIFNTPLDKKAKKGNVCSLATCVMPSDIQTANPEALIIPIIPA